MTQSCNLSVNGQRLFHRYLKKPLFQDIDLLAWLSGESTYPKCYWKSREEDLEIGAIGEVLYLSSPPTFASDNDSPARFWGGQAFFSPTPFRDEIWKDFPQCAFFLPKMEIIKSGQKCTIVVNAINAPINESIEISSHFFEAGQCSLKEPTYFPDFHGWNHLMRSAFSHMNKKIFEKIVLARRTTMAANHHLDPYFFLSKLKQINVAATLFGVQFHENSAFVGASPERLYQRNLLELRTEALAATQKRGKTKEEDALLEKLLLEDSKLLQEFAFVETSIIEALTPLASNVKNEEQKTVRKTPNVQHLCTKISAHLNPNTSDEALLNALHPTAALGGFPRRSSLKLLQEKESFERGWYGSPFGYISQEKAEFIVAIRSALMEKKCVHLFAGAGIVKESDPLKEWEELNAKTALWEGILK